MKFDFSKYGVNVFNDASMRERLPKSVYKSLKRSIDEGLPLDPQIADTVAQAMKDWAVELGATHYNHWFAPMTNITAGKHESFISVKDDSGVLLEFSGKELIKGEPDASSFPSGGLRNTFEARGYTAWDCTSPAFVRDNTLYIPTAFCSYTGEALDMKTPILRSMDVLSAQALRILRLFGNDTVKRVNATVGAEQEYFLIDRQTYEKRLDLKICGRTLFGARPPKGQEMDDHYFGRIRIRVQEYMRQLDAQLWELGVPSKTKHNEVAPTQHELAPIFESVNVACDHNQLIMEVMRTVAKKNGLACLLHEKPFSWINGSGKHNNWSICTNDGANLLDPGKTPYENIQFLVFLCAVIDAVDDYADLLRMSAAIAGNDYRLGSSEAPPAIISIFLGEHLTAILNEIAQGKVHNGQTGADVLQTGVATLPMLKKDDSDRNRTSPFAFTGNKFEFRMVGSSASIATANFVLNTIVAQSLDKFATRLENADNFDNEIKAIISDTMEQHGKVIFNGNNYTDEWVKEAEKRSLPNLKDTVEAAGALINPKNIEVMQKYGILSEIESHSRYEIMLENFVKIINIEASTMLEMAKKQIMPAAVEQMGIYASSYNQLKQAGIENKTLLNKTRYISELIENISVHLDSLTEHVNRLHEDFGDAHEQAVFARDTVRSDMNSLRELVDVLEGYVEQKRWPMPTYTDLLYRV